MLLLAKDILNNDALAAAITGPGGGIGNYLLLTSTIQHGFISLRVNDLPADDINNYWCGVGGSRNSLVVGSGTINNEMFGCYNLYKL